MTKPRWVVWKHDCTRHGMVDANGERPCEPPCEEPWQVDANWPRQGDTFPTWAEAMAYVAKEAKAPCPPSP